METLLQNHIFQRILLTDIENKISTLIHPTAIVEPTAKLGLNVAIGPYSVIQENTEIGDESTIGNNTIICKNTKIGSRCKIFHSSSIGEIPQDLKFEGEETETIIGDETIIREYVTVNRGTKALGKTEIGSKCLLMASTHVAHDCILGNNVILSNLTTLGGHVNISDWVVLGGGVLVHQFTHIGEHAFVGGGFRVVQDIPPFILAADNPLQFKGINNVGLKRRGFSSEDRKLIKSIYKIYFRSGKNKNDALSTIQSEFQESEVAKKIITFINQSNRGII